MNHSIRLETRLLSSLEKVFADSGTIGPEYKAATALRNETFSFQVAYRASDKIQGLKVKADSRLEPYIQLRSVGLVPSELPVYTNHDDDVLRTTPGLYPDPLYPIDPEGLTVPGGQWRSVWIIVDLNGEAEPGNYPIRISFANQNGELLGEETFHLEVLEPLLPEQTLIHTEWFHCDCLSNYYRVEMFSEPHWKLVERYVKTAVDHGMNMILTPIFTPPLDTAVGGERKTAQLVDVWKNGGEYAFGFDKLARWIELCSGLGIRYFEFAHLFTQWGAKHAPKIMGWEDGTYRRLFGWETDATSDEYRRFLDTFLPELVRFIRQHGLEKRSYFHVSDEPHLNDLESYRAASEILDKHLADFPRIDALSDFAFYGQGLVPHPVPSTDHLEPFLEHGVEGLWTYYCCSQGIDVSNRFFSFPSARNRILGMQLYKFGIKGFLHWGYNFWNTQYSRKAINPFQVTDAGLAFPSGDAFVVYPGEDGPIESLRLKVFVEGLQDMRALQLLEQLVGRGKAVQVLEEGLDRPITFKQYPRSAEWLLAKREQINRLIAQHA